MPPSPSTPTPGPATEYELEALFDAGAVEVRESRLAPSDRVFTGPGPSLLLF